MNVFGAISWGNVYGKFLFLENTFTTYLKMIETFVFSKF